jgi:hypothetical protein
MELRDLNCVLKTRFNHYKICAEIESRRTTELEARITELEAIVSAVPVAVIEPPVVVIEPVPVAVIEPMPPVAIDMLPHGYYFEGATTTVNNVSFPVVRGPNFGYHTLRSAFVLKRLSAIQFSRMVRE